MSACSRLIMPLVVATVLVAPVAAQASTVGLADPTDVTEYKGGSYTSYALVLTAGAGERNVVRITPEDGGLTVTDAAGVVPGTGCRRGASDSVAVCAGIVDRGRATLGDEDDELTAGLGFLGRLVVDGGTGNDVLNPRSAASVHGGEGDDLLRGGPGGQVSLDGGPGADVLVGSDRFSGDVAVYGDREQPVTVTLDGIANDGELGEGDNVAGEIEDVQGGSADDLLVGDDGDNTLLGGQGADVLRGRGGRDVLIGEAGSDALTGGTGDDRLHSFRSPFASLDETGDPPDAQPSQRRDGHGLLDGGAGHDELTGGPASDLLRPGGGSDVVEGGGGSDEVDARDVSLDRITCADRGHAGTAQLDRLDLVRRCASVRRDGPGAARFTLIGQSDIDRDGVVRVGIGCPQDVRGGCRGTLRLANAGGVLATRRVSVRPGAARLYRVSVRVPGVFGTCERSLITARLVTRTTRGATVTTRARTALGSTALRCNFPSIGDNHDGW